MPRRTRALLLTPAPHIRHLHTLPIRRLPVLPPANLANDDARHIRQPHDAGDDAVRNLARARVARQLQAQAAVDDAQRDDAAAQPDVRVGPEDAAFVGLEEVVVQEAQDGLEEEEDEEDYADYWVVVV